MDWVLLIYTWCCCMPRVSVTICTILCISWEVSEAHQVCTTTFTLTVWLLY